MLGRITAMRVGLLLLATGAWGCSTIAATAVPTGDARRAPRTGGVAIYSATQPRGGSELGIVEVHASQNEGTVENLLPLFVAKVASLGGNAAVIDSVHARFDVVTRPSTETYAYPCGFRAMCVGTRFYNASDEVMTVSMRGRAFHVPGAENGPRIPESTPPIEPEREEDSP